MKILGVCVLTLGLSAAIAATLFEEPGAKKSLAPKAQTFITRPYTTRKPYTTLRPRIVNGIHNRVRPTQLKLWKPYTTPTPNKILKKTFNPEIAKPFTTRPFVNTGRYTTKRSNSWSYPTKPNTVTRERNSL